MGDLPDRGLCPIRFLRYYLDHTAPTRGTRKKLFIAFQKGYFEEIKPATVSSWLKSIIVLAYKECKPEDLKQLGVKAHQVLSIASSWALLGGVFVSDTMSACHWATHNTFTSFYLQPLAWQNEDGCLLGLIITAQNQISFPNSLKTKQ